MQVVNSTARNFDRLLLNLKLFFIVDLTEQFKLELPVPGILLAGFLSEIYY